jgi:hypothetical protein
MIEHLALDLGKVLSGVLVLEEAHTLTELKPPLGVEAKERIRIPPGFLHAHVASISQGLVRKPCRLKAGRCQRHLS